MGKENLSPKSNKMAEMNAFGGWVNSQEMETTEVAAGRPGVGVGSGARLESRGEDREPAHCGGQGRRLLAIGQALGEVLATGPPARTAQQMSQQAAKGTGPEEGVGVLGTGQGCSGPRTALS